VDLLVVDPVMVAKSGDALLSESARETLKKTLLPMAYLVTPNLPEASVLCGFPVKDLESMKESAKVIKGMGPRYVLIKGGHLEKQAVDLLFDGEGFERYEAPRLSGQEHAWDRVHLLRRPGNASRPGAFPVQGRGIGGQEIYHEGHQPGVWRSGQAMVPPITMHMSAFTRKERSVLRSRPKRPWKSSWMNLSAL
jgi:hypothetical protein